jgi:hypothetical protein
VCAGVHEREMGSGIAHVKRFVVHVGGTGHVKGALGWKGGVSNSF